ncbi:MAG: YlcI/YnfO family protein [Pseudoxanthomonas sp.]
MSQAATKNATLPSLRVSAEFRKAAEDVLQEGETLSAFVEASVRAQVNLRRNREEFIKRGLASYAKAEETGVYYSLDQVLGKLEAKLAKAKATAK